MRKDAAFHWIFAVCWLQNLRTQVANRRVANILRATLSTSRHSAHFLQRKKNKVLREDVQCTDREDAHKTHFFPIEKRKRDASAKQKHLLWRCAQNSDWRCIRKAPYGRIRIRCQCRARAQTVCCGEWARWTAKTAHLLRASRLTRRRLLFEREAANSEIPTGSAGKCRLGRLSKVAGRCANWAVRRRLSVGAAAFLGRFLSLFAKFAMRHGGTQNSSKRTGGDLTVQIPR